MYLEYLELDSLNDRLQRLQKATGRKKTHLLILKPFGSKEIKAGTASTSKIETPTLKILIWEAGSFASISLELLIDGMSLGTVHLPSTHARQAVDDGLLQLLLGDLECDTDNEGPCVIGVIGSNHNNRLCVGSRSDLKMWLQSEKKEQE